MVDRPVPVTHEPELLGPVDLCDARGRLHPAARGWSRTPQLRANLRGGPFRKKRWDYWCVQTDEIVVSFVYADVDYAGLANVWVLDRATEQQATAGILRPLARGISLPDQVCTDAVSVVDRALTLVIDERDTYTRITASAPASAHGPIEVDVRIDKPAGHESLNVVIPWSDRRFQFTSKQNTRPATGTVRVGDRAWTIDADRDAWGVQDLGRGIWPYRNRWNWAAASGRAVDGRVVGLQFGGKWTEGTGATENALCIDGHLTKIGVELEWTYDWEHPMRPWRVRTPDSEQVDAVLTPTFDRYDVTDLKVLKMEVHQCFGTWSGRVVGDDGVPVEFEGVRGFAEEARNRW
ncbi:MAG: DUF2804 domain-containing protein [Acidimicrobiales bacterium]|nr:DUF2804 domain-containing protein [Acidimicrobiales bacterium]MCB9394785.1 DUF2804 domain-containing protein [Acidimicrobiaceae bacterium]